MKFLILKSDNEWALLRDFGLRKRLGADGRIFPFFPGVFLMVSLSHSLIFVMRSGFYLTNSLGDIVNAMTSERALSYFHWGYTKKEGWKVGEGGPRRAVGDVGSNNFNGR